MLRSFSTAAIAFLALFVGGCDGTARESSPRQAAEPVTVPLEPVTVPRVTQTNVTFAYELLHKAGLQVAIPETFSVAALWEPGPESQSPHAGTPVPPGTVVTLHLRGGPLGSPAWRPHAVTVRDLVGMRASDALAWIEDANLFYEVRDIPPLPASDAAHLFDAYRVTRQSPAPGSRLSPGILGKSGGFRPTPVVLWVSLTSPVKGFVASTVAVPDVVGLSEGKAVKLLDSAGLVANVRYGWDAPRTGEVYRSAPAAGSDVPDRSAVVLYISLPRRLPPPGQEHEMEIGPLGRLVARHPEVFVGLYRDEAAIPHVAFGPGADPEEWADRLTEAAQGISYPAEGIGYRVDTCSRDRRSLRAIQDEITTDQSWTQNKHLAFAVWVQPETCTVRVESDQLMRADIAALVVRYGTAVSFDTSKGAAPILLDS